jgi:hypothetical protein
MAFWVFGAAIAGAMLFVALTGRRGEIWLRILLGSYALVWLSSVSAYAMAIWLARDLPEGANLMAIGRSRRPDDAVASRVWWWTRASWYGWLAVAGFLAVCVAFAVSGAFADC